MEGGRVNKQLIPRLDVIKAYKVMGLNRELKWDDLCYFRQKTPATKYMKAHEAAHPEYVDYYVKEIEILG